MMKIGYRIDDQKIDGSLRNLAAELDSLKGLGLQCVELPAHGMDVIRNCEIDASALNKVQEILREYDLEYTVHCADPMNLMDEDNIRDNLALFASSLEFCRQIGSNIFVYHPGRYISEEEFNFNYGKKTDQARRNELLERERAYIKEMAETFPEIKICMENARPYKNMPHYCYAEEMDKLVEQVKAIDRPNAGITLDVGHLNLSAGSYKFDPLEAVAGAKEYIAHVHLHDNFGKACYHHEKKQTHLIPLGKGDCHMPIGQGNAPIKGIVDCLGAGYKGVYIFEYRSRYKEFLKESVAVLKEWFL